MKRKNRSILIISVVFILITFATLFALFLFMNYENFTIESIKENELSSFKREYESVLNGYRNYSQFIYENIINDKSVLEKVSLANEDRENISIYHDDLYKYLLDLYTYISEDDFRQLHFHFPDITSFLRMHRFSKYGDSLLDVRESVRIANEENKYVEGFEEGRIFNGYRFVYPLEYNEEQIGSVEISISIAAILRSLSELFCETYQFIIKKNVVEEKLFDEELTNYISSTVSENYYYDVEVETEIENINELCVVFVESEKINKQLRLNIDEDLQRGEEFSRVVNISNETFVASFFPVKNFRDEVVAYIINYSQNNTIKQHRESFLILIIFLIVLYVMLMIIVFLIWRSRSKYEHFSSTDSLTNVNNRKGFFDGLKFMYDKAVKDKKDLYFLIFDLDHFKRINDNYGHSVGDYVLKILSEIITSNIRSTDFFGRWGGDEFVLAISGVSDDISKKIGEKLLKLVSEFDFDIEEKVTISIGLSKLNEDETIDSLLKRADEELYKAKNSGRNKISFSF